MAVPGVHRLAGPCRRCARLAFAAMLALCALAPAREARTAAPGLRLLAADEHGALVELVTPGYHLSTATTGGSFRRFSLPGQAPPARRDGLPRTTFLLGVPPDGTVSLRLVESDTIPLPGRIRLDINLPHSLYPGEPARLTGLAWLRDRRIARIELSPFQYDPASQQVFWNRRLRVRVEWDSGSAAPSRPGLLDPYLRTLLLNGSSLPEWPAAPPPAAASGPITGPAPPGLRLGVQADGIYRLTYSDLLAAGGGLASADPRNLYMTSQGRPVALFVSGEADGVFDPEDSVTFYGQAFDGGYLASQHPGAGAHWLTFGSQTDDGSAADWQPQAGAAMFEKYTRENVYWLSAGITPGLRMAAVEGAPAGAPAAAPYFTETLRVEHSYVWWTTHFTGEDTWFWEWIQDTPRRTFTATLPGPADSAPVSATVRAEMVAYSQNAEAGPDHHAQLYWNGAPAPFGEAFWDGLSRRRLEAPLPMASILAGDNQLHVVLSPTAAIPYPQVFFDWLEVDYARAFRAEADSLLFSLPAGPLHVEVGGFSSPSIEVYDLTDPLAPVRVLSPAVMAGSEGTFTAAFDSAPAGGGRYLAAAAPAVRAPDSAEYVEPVDLWSSANGADYVFIAPAEFVTATRRLAAYRAAQGLRTSVASLDDVYNQFLHGIRHPQAIRNFLAHAFANWTAPAPAYVLLVGDGHWNPLGHAPDKFGTAPVLIPPNLSWVDPWQGEVDSANLLATLAGDDPLPDLAIGRLPANSLAELDAMIDKTIAYEASPPAAWQARLAFVADDVPDPAGDFVALTEALISDKLPPAFQADRFYLNDYVLPADLTRQLTQTLSLTGTLLLNYTGHAAWDRWAAEGIFTLDSLASLENAGRLPVLLSMTCLDGYWIFPHLPGLAESLVRAEARGAAAAFSPTGLGVATGHDSLQRGFYDAVFRDGIWTLGPATLAAKLSVYATGADEDLIHTFTIFGDPALRLLGPGRPALSPASASALAAPGTSAAYLVRVDNPAAEAASFDVLAGSLAWSVTAQPSALSLAPGQSAEVRVTVSVPPGAVLGSSDTAYLTLASQANAAVSASGFFTTVAAQPGAFLPLVARPPDVP